MPSPIPAGYHTVTPYLVVRGAAKLLEFAQAAFDAEILRRYDMPGGLIGHSEVRIGDSLVMMADATEQHPPTEAGLHLFVPDVDATYRRALAAGATSMREPADQFYGDRGAVVRDFTGTWWSLATHVEDVSDEEMMRRAAEHAASAK